MEVTQCDVPTVVSPVLFAKSLFYTQFGYKCLLIFRTNICISRVKWVNL